MKFNLQTKGHYDFVDITARVEQAVSKSNIKNKRGFDPCLFFYGVHLFRVRCDVVVHLFLYRLKPALQSLSSFEIFQEIVLLYKLLNYYNIKLLYKLTHS